MSYNPSTMTILGNPLSLCVVGGDDLSHILVVNFLPSHTLYGSLYPCPHNLSSNSIFMIAA